MARTPEPDNTTAEVRRTLSSAVDQHLHGVEGSVDDVMCELLAAVRQYFGMEVAFVSELLSCRRVFRYVDQAGDVAIIRVNDSDPLDDSYCQRIIDGHLPQLITDAQQLAVAQGLTATAAMPIGAHLSVPIELSDGIVFGTFCAFSREADDELDETDLALMRVFAQVAAALIEQNRDAIASSSAERQHIEALLANGEPEPAFQPIVALETGTIAGFEALARCPSASNTPPNRVFEAAGRVGLESALTAHLIEQAHAALAELPGESRVAVNVSPGMILGKNLAALIGDFPPERLAIEVTEHAVVDDYSGIREAFEPLRQAGTRMAVDDVGAGYASLSHILSLRPDVIKLDISLTRDIETDSARQYLASGLVEFAQGAGYDLIAEGVETEAERRTLLERGYRFGQGYLFARPQPASSFRGVSVGA